MLQAFVDESGRGQNYGAYVCAGFVAPVETWLVFARDWQIVLDLEPSLAYFKAREAAHKMQQFRGWSDTDRDIRLDAFWEVIRSHKVTPIRISIPQKHYARIFKGKLSRKFDNPFWVPTYSIVMVTLGFLMNRRATDKVDFVFDSVLPKEEKFMRSGWEFYSHYAVRGTKPLIGNAPEFRSEKEVLPLQAADLHAWHARQQSVASSRGNTYENPHWNLLRSLGGAEREWNAADLKGVFDMVPRTAEGRRAVQDKLRRGGF